MKVLVLGHTGMLGDAVSRYLNTRGHEVLTLPTELRWPSIEMENQIRNTEAGWIINCIGAIPQRKPLDHEYFELNSRLPFFLFTLTSKKIIHAATDCEFSGKIKADEFYEEDAYLDATDLYGISKPIPAEYVYRAHLPHVKMIRTSIIGIEKNSSVSLLNWFISASGKGETITGFNNHYWNGITTLEWAKIADSIIEGKFTDTLVQVATSKVSKFELLKKMANVFRPGYTIHEATHPKYQNKCLASRWEVKDIEVLLKELKEFYHL